MDITHEVDPQDVREGAYLVEEYYQYFEKETIHMAVVDPTVGSNRRPIVFNKGRYFFIGPDNGLFTLMYDDSIRIYTIENSRYMGKKISPTFHGRDIFAALQPIWLPVFSFHHSAARLKIRFYLQIFTLLYKETF